MTDIRTASFAGAFLDYGGQAFNVKHPEFGAVGDGSTDDTDAIQAALTAAAAVSGTVVIPPGTYPCSGTSITGGQNLKVVGPGATIVQTAKAVVFDWEGSWGATNTISSIATGTVTVNSTTRYTSVLTLSTTPSDLAVDDIVKVFSSDTIPESRFSSRKKGEFAVVARIDGNDVYLNGVLRDTYSTTPRVARLDPATVHIEGLAFEIDNSIDTGTGSGSGADALVRVRAARAPVLKDITINGPTVSNGLVLQSCYGYLVTGLIARDMPSDETLSRFGYGVVDAQSEFGLVQHCHFTQVRHGFTTNTYTLADDGSPENYGRSAFTTVSDCIGVGNSGATFDTHSEAYSIRFVDCLHTHGTFRDTDAAATPQGFQIRSDASVLDSCVVEDCYKGFEIATATDRQGGNTPSNWIHTVTLRNCRAVRTRSRALVLSRVNNAIVEGCDFGDSVDTPTSSDGVAVLTDSGVSFLATNFQFLNGDATIGIVRVLGSAQGNGTRTDFNGCVFDFTRVNLDGSSRVTNYNSYVVMTRDAYAHQVSIRNSLVECGSRPVAALINHYSSTGANQNTYVDIDGVLSRADTGSVTCADTSSRASGLAAFVSNFNAGKTTVTRSRQVENASQTIDLTTDTNGTATLANGNTTVTVTHGLGITPTLPDIGVTPIEAWGSMTQFWVTSPTSTQFTINADQDPGQDVDFVWAVSVR